MIIKDSEKMFSMEIIGYEQEEISDEERYYAASCDWLNFRFKVKSGDMDFENEFPLALVKEVQELAEWFELVLENKSSYYEFYFNEPNLWFRYIKNSGIEVVLDCESHPDFSEKGYEAEPFILNFSFNRDDIEACVAELKEQLKVFKSRVLPEYADK